MKNNKFIVLTVMVTVLLAALLFMFIPKRYSEDTYTGGSGRAEVGYLILHGYDKPSNDEMKIPLGDFLTIDQQKSIRTSIEALLFEMQPEREYKGSILAESIKVDYVTNVIQFKVTVEDPKVTYLIQYNTVSDEMSIFDSTGKKLEPPKSA